METKVKLEHEYKQPLGANLKKIRNDIEKETFLSFTVQSENENA